MQLKNIAFIVQRSLRHNVIIIVVVNKCNLLESHILYTNQNATMRFRFAPNPFAFAFSFHFGMYSISSRLLAIECTPNSVRVVITNNRLRKRLSSCYISMMINFTLEHCRCDDSFVSCAFYVGCFVSLRCTAGKICEWIKEKQKWKSLWLVEAHYYYYHHFIV